MGREQGLNESGGSASAIPTWRGRPSTATAYPPDWRGSKLGLGTQIAQNHWQPLFARGCTFLWLFQPASLPSSLAWANRELQNCLVSSRPDLCLRGLCYLKRPQDSIACSWPFNMSLAISLPLCGQLQGPCDLLVTCHRNI